MTALQLTAAQDPDWKCRQKLGLISFSGCICENGRVLETFQPPTSWARTESSFSTYASRVQPSKCAEFFFLSSMLLFGNHLMIYGPFQEHNVSRICCPLPPWASLARVCSRPADFLYLNSVSCNSRTNLQFDMGRRRWPISSYHRAAQGRLC